MLDAQQVGRPVRRGSGTWNRMHSRLGLSLLVVIVLLCPMAAHAQPWIPTDIGAASGIVTSNAIGANDLGHVTGYFVTGP